MDSRLSDLLQNREENYVLPFLWLHGENEESIRLEIDKIYESGIRAVCVESRPHPDFVGDGWWHDMDIVMDEARKRNMRVWVLDDVRFPTGYAAGRIKDEYPELRKWYLNERHVDVLGEMRGASVLVNAHLQEGEKLIGVAAAEYCSQEGRIGGSLLDLSAYVADGVLYWDIPAGFWRIFILVMTRNGGYEITKDYLNPIIPEAVNVLIESVYESHYTHYKEDFGKTFAGFFSDEPQFGNIWSMEASIGRCPMVLPWREDMIGILEKEFGGDIVKYLPCLWYDAGRASGRIRYLYMNVLTDLYSKSFSGQLGEWCRKHHVEYIGHVIEDNNVHARLGAGTGHYFRSLWGQDMAGVDVVLQQLRPGFDRKFRMVTRVADGEFYHYGLAKMASSLGHVDPKKKGRTVCENFGAYGWYEGLKLMKWLTDHMLVRGVNYFVPHAFSPKEYPDGDCPPHFYAQGNNPQFRYFKILMEYINRICHLLNGGNHIAPVAVLYHAEAEWSGEYMLFQKPVKILLQNQIDCDVIPADAFLNGLSIRNGELCIHEEKYKCLVIPYAEYLPEAVLQSFNHMIENGVRVYFIDKMPLGACEGTCVENILEKIKAGNRVKTIGLDHLAEELRTDGIGEIEVKDTAPYLRYYHYRRENSDFFMFFNEHPYLHLNTDVIIPVRGALYLYDAFDNTMKEQAAEFMDQRAVIHLDLSPYESKIFVTDAMKENCEHVKSAYFKKNMSCISLEPSKGWKVSAATAQEYPVFKFRFMLNKLENLCRPQMLPGFSGTLRYETEFQWNHESGEVFIDLGEVYETAEVWINGRLAGIRICPPYRFNITDSIVTGKNDLVADITNTLVKEQRDRFSIFAQQEPTGLLGPVTIHLSLVK